MTENKPRLIEYIKDLIYFLIKIVDYLVDLLVFAFAASSASALIYDTPFKSGIFMWGIIVIGLGEIRLFQKIHLKDNPRLFTIGLIGVGIFNYLIVFLCKLVLRLTE